MTDTLDPEKVEELRLLVDQGLGDMQSRELVSAGEVADLLLDIRLLLTVAETEAQLN